MYILGKHPGDDQVISIYSGRYGPYVKHGSTNATIPDKEKADSITLEEAVSLIEEKAGVIKPKTKVATKRKVAVTKKKPALKKVKA